jgi:hypothetical protein
MTRRRVLFAAIAVGLGAMVVALLSGQAAGERVSTSTGGISEVGSAFIGLLVGVAVSVFVVSACDVTRGGLGGSLMSGTLACAAVASLGGFVSGDGVSNRLGYAAVIFIAVLVPLVVSAIIGNAVRLVLAAPGRSGS